MFKVGFVGWRGMVGSVLLQRMREMGDFTAIKPVFFSTSNIGGCAPDVGVATAELKDAYLIEELARLDCIISTQGSDYTDTVLTKLRGVGWNGYWLDASSLLRLDEKSIVVLDPLNRELINNGLKNGIKQFIGGNCTVSLMLMALHGLIKEDLVEWVSSMTYQAASGAGANNMRELLTQNGVIYTAVKDKLEDKNSNILDIVNQVNLTVNATDFPTKYFSAPLALNVLPWIDGLMANGQTKEEWKGGVEANKILGYTPNQLKIDGICVRVGALRSHAQALTIKLKRTDLSLAKIEELLTTANPWVKLVANTKEDSLCELTPISVSSNLTIALGRLKRLQFGDEYISLFTVGDQLLWGAAEPLRRMLNILVEHYA